MILVFSAVVQRYRRWILLAAVVAGGGAVVDAVRAPAEPSAALVAVALVAALTLVTGAVIGIVFRWHMSCRFEVNESRRAFRTPRSATPVFVALFLIAAVAFLAEAGGWPWAHGDRDGGWLLIMVLMGVPALLFAAVAWRGHGISLTPNGIHADHATGTLTIPWTALSADQPRPGIPPAEDRLDLAFAHPGQVSRSGLVLRTNRIFFEGTQPAFAAAAIQHYATHPADRPMIGTHAGHRQLVELLVVPAGPVQRPPSRRRIAGLAALGATVLAATVAGDTWVGVTIGRHSVPGYATGVLRQVSALVSLSLFAAAVRGIRARRTPASRDTHLASPQPTPPQREQKHPPTRAPTMPTWARDVTGNS